MPTATVRAPQQGQQSVVAGFVLALAGAIVFALALEFAGLGALSWLALAPLLHLQARLNWFPAAALTAATILPVYLLIGRPYVEISPALVILGPLLLALMYGCGGAACALLARSGRWSPATVASVWVLIELVKSACGLEFGSAGYTQWSLAPVRGFAAIGGAVGVSWIVWYANAWLARLCSPAGRGLRPTRLARRQLAFPAVLLLLFAGNHAFGAWGHDVGSVDVIAVPRHDTTEDRRRARMDVGYRQDVLGEMFAASTAGNSGAEGAPRLVVWPETACQLYPERDHWLEDAFEEADLASNVTLLTGAFGGVPAPPVMGFNSVFAFDGAGDIRARYDKHRLIPFDEYQPLRAVSSFLFDREVLTEFNVGLAPEPLELPWGKVAVSICYEETFAEGFRRQTDAGAAVLVTCANYSYFASPLAPRFMHALASFRAAECDRWLVRVCNRGPVEVLDPRGRTHIASAFSDETRPLAEHVVEASVPLRAGRTPFVAVGHWLIPLGIVLRLLGALCLGRHQAPTPTSDPLDDFS